MAEDQVAARRAKRDFLREEGINPYPDSWKRTHTLVEARELAEGTAEVAVAGRVMLKRQVSKKMIFLTIQDRSGQMQACLRRDTLDAEPLRILRRGLDNGDFIGLRGNIWVTRTGEITLDAVEAVVLSKSLRPMPEKWAGLQDTESCYRQRYLDLLTNESTRERFRFRSAFVKSIRNYLDDHAFEEVETPVIQTKASGALAKPFLSHHNALDMEVTMRIAPETWLKRLLVGGYERVYEFARCFRNEGMDPSHLQDFTMLEYYVAFWSYRENMRFTQELLQHVVQETTGSMNFTCLGQDGTERHVDLTGEWPAMKMTDLIQEKAGIDVTAVRDPAELREWCKGKGLYDPSLEKMAYPSLVDFIYKRTVRPDLIGPMFVIGHPIELSPLARRNDEKPGITDRFQLLINGWEVVNAYSELVDPDDQRGRFEDQAANKAAGDDEALDPEDDYMLCMEYGMPPASGWGMGIDRMVALIQGQTNLRDAVLFPLMRPL